MVRRWFLSDDLALSGSGFGSGMSTEGITGRAGGEPDLTWDESGCSALVVGGFSFDAGEGGYHMVFNNTRHLSLLTCS